MNNATARSYGLSNVREVIFPMLPRLGCRFIGDRRVGRRRRKGRRPTRASGRASRHRSGPAAGSAAAARPARHASAISPPSAASRRGPAAERGDPAPASESSAPEGPDCGAISPLDGPRSSRHPSRRKRPTQPATGWSDRLFPPPVGATHRLSAANQSVPGRYRGGGSCAHTWADPSRR